MPNTIMDAENFPCPSTSNAHISISATPEASEARKPLAPTTGNRFGFKSIPAPSVLKPPSLVKSKLASQSSELQQTRPAETKRASSVGVSSPINAAPRHGDTSVTRNDKKFEIGTSSNSSRKSPRFVNAHPVGTDSTESLPGKRQRPAGPAPGSSTIGVRTRSAAGNSTRKATSTVTSSSSANLPAISQATGELPDASYQQSHKRKSSSSNNAFDEADALDTLVEQIYGADYTERTREVLNAGVKSTKNTTTSRYAHRQRSDEQTAWIRGLRTALRDGMDKQSAFVAAMKEYEMKLRTEYFVVVNEVKSGKKVNEDLRSQISRLEQRVDQMTNDAMSSFNKKDELLEEQLQLVNKQQEVLAAKSKAESEKAEISLKLAEANIRCEALQKDLDVHKAELLKMEEVVIQTKSEQRLVVEEEAEKWKQKLLEAEKQHSSRLLDMEKQGQGQHEEQKALSQQKTEAESRVLALENELAKRDFMYQEHLKEVERLQSALKEKEQEITLTRERLSQKDSEVAQALRSFAQVQTFAQDAHNKVEAEKKAIEQQLSELKAETTRTDTERALTNAELERTKQEAKALTDKLAILSQELQGAKRACEESKSKAQELDRSAAVERELRALLESQMRELRTEYIALNAQMQAVRVEAAAHSKTLESEIQEEKRRAEAVKEYAEDEKRSLQQQLLNLEHAKVELESELRTLKDSENKAKDTDLARLCEVTKEADILRLRLRELDEQKHLTLTEKDRRIVELEQKVAEGESTRRKMHNLIQELRGNVRVFVRARPILPSDNIPTDTTLSVTCLADGQSMRLSHPIESRIEPIPFTFDKTFPPSAGQDSVFEEVSEFVQSALDGYNVCLFSYGQTGSGKTHTMQGSGFGQMRGIIPRSIEKVMEQSKTLGAQGWRYSMQVSFLEIYNENIRDLLCPKAIDDKKHDIKRDTHGKMYITDLTVIPVDDPSQIEGLMEQAAKHRSVGFTEMNAQSSRSHSVFTLYLKGENETMGAALDGRLNLCDLAGSERLARSQATGDRLKETQAINKSLSCLTDVFVALANKNAHVPFRNSKLTYLLQDCLSGDGKTLMMVNLSPTPESYSESLCSLRFARQVNQCELGKPKRQIKTKSVSLGSQENDDDSSTSRSQAAKTTKRAAINGTDRRGVISR